MTTKNELNYFLFIFSHLLIFVQKHCFLIKTLFFKIITIFFSITLNSTKKKNKKKNHSSLILLLSKSKFLKFSKRELIKFSTF